MHENLKYIWVGLILFCIIGMLMSVPVEKAQKGLKNTILKKKLAPQARLNATNKYLEDYENGKVDKIYLFGDSPELKSLYEAELNNLSEQQNETPQPKFRTPLYIRDKNNPNIVHKYSYSGEYTTRTSAQKSYRYTGQSAQNVRKPLYLRDKNNYNIYYPVYP